MPPRPSHDDNANDLARRLDDEAEERRILTALLIHQQPRPEPAQESANQAGRLTLAEKLFGKKS